MLNVHVQYTIISSIMGLTDWGLIRDWECNKNIFLYNQNEINDFQNECSFIQTMNFFITLSAANKPSICNRGKNDAIFKIIPIFFIYTIFWMKLHPFWNLILVTDSIIIWLHLWG